MKNKLTKIELLERKEEIINNLKKDFNDGNLDFYNSSIKNIEKLSDEFINDIIKFLEDNKNNTELLILYKRLDDLEDGYFNFINDKYYDYNFILYNEIWKEIESIILENKEEYERYNNLEYNEEILDIINFIKLEDIENFEEEFNDKFEEIIYEIRLDNSDLENEIIKMMNNILNKMGIRNFILDIYKDSYQEINDLYKYIYDYMICNNLDYKDGDIEFQSNEMMRLLYNNMEYWNYIYFLAKCESEDFDDHELMEIYFNE